MLADHLIILNVRKIPTPVFSQSFSLSFPITSPIQYIAESHSSAFVSLIGTVSHLLRYEPLRFRKHNAISTGECVDEANKCGKVLTRKKLRHCIFMVVNTTLWLVKVFHTSSRYHLRMRNTCIFATAIFNRNYFSVFFRI